MIAALVTQTGARLACYFRGHRRGKRIETLDNGQLKRYRCPRCKSTWDRKAKA